MNIPFKSYCWALGTTSFRTKNFNINIERQLDYLDLFWNEETNANKLWRDAQTEYYEFLKKKGFLTGEAEREDKDARQKTSGLVDIGLINSERRLTSVGKELLRISRNKDFSSDNILELEKDSYIYFKQLLKTTNLVDGQVVRPYIVLAYMLSQLQYLTFDEFTYCLPLCTNSSNTYKMVCDIIKLRGEKLTVDDIIFQKLMSMPNYQVAKQYFLENIVTEEIILTVGMNRKSRTGGANYDKAYFDVYQLLKQVVLYNKHELAVALFNSIKQIKNSPCGMWKQLLFKTTNSKAVERDGFKSMKQSEFFEAKSENEFKEIFFRYLHLFKAKTNLHDYFDLNRRYFKCTDTLVVADGKVEFDIMLNVFFSKVSEKLMEVAFTQEERLQENIKLEDISRHLYTNPNTIYKELGIKVGKTVTSASEAKQVVKDERYTRMDNLIKSKFSRTQLSHLFTLFEERKDDEIRKLVTDNADIPTIFEYVLGIAWYVISDKKGDILEYMKLSLETDLLPKSHAVGGDADIVYEYAETSDYPEHTLLIEATLAEKNNQRRMEMEPVSRHLGDYLISNPSKVAYCIFATTYLHINVISDFRSRKHSEYFNLNGTKSVNGMKIIPLQTSEFKAILDKCTTYAMLYPILENAFKSEVSVREWYGKEIKNNIL
ncbi:MAG: AlwI family type II restriction endonuclease [Oscillospiraceae bacterium]